MSQPTLAIQIQADVSQVAKSITQLTGDFKAFADRVVSGSASAEAGMKRLGAHTEVTGKSFAMAGLGAFGLVEALRKIAEFAQGVVDKTMQMEKAQRTLEYAMGNGAAGMVFARQVARELGLDLIVTAQSYASLSAASKGTRMEGVGTEKVFKAIASAASVLSLSADDTRGVLLAVGQMMSKGKVQAEELRGQLGERLPGAFNIAARAMGVTTAELDKMLKDGKVLAEDFLPKFAVELQKSLGDAPKQSANTMQGSLNRLKTSWTDFLVGIGQGGVMQTLAQEFGLLATKLDQAASNGVAQDLANTFKQVIHIGSGLASALITWRGELLALGKAWIVMKVAVGGYGWITGVIQAIRGKMVATQAAVSATVQAVASEHGLVLASQASASAQLFQAKAVIASRLAKIEALMATGGLTIAEGMAQRQALLLTQARLAEAAATTAATTAARGASLAMAAMGGPVTLIVLALAGLFYAWGRIADASKKAAEEQRQAIQSSLERATQAKSLIADLKALSEAEGKHGEKLKDGVNATQEFKLAKEKVMALGPAYRTELIKQTENANQLYRALLNVNRQEALRNLAQVDKSLAKEEAQSRNLAPTFGQKVKATLIGAFNPAGAQTYLAESFGENLKANNDRIDELRKQKAELQGVLQETESLLNGETKPDSGGGGDDKPQKERTYQEWLRKLEMEQLTGAKAQTLEQERQIALRRQEVQFAETLEKIDKDKGLTSKEAHALKAQAWKNSFDRIQAIHAEFDQKRVASQFAVQEKLEVAEEGGLTKRLARVRKHFEAIREENRRAGGGIDESVILSAQAAAEEQERLAQIKQDLQELKRELSELAQIKGRALTLGEEGEVLDRFGAKGETQGAAVKQFKGEQHREEGAGAGVKASLQGYLDNSKNKFETWKQGITSILGGVENSFATLFQNIFQRGMTGAQKWKALWKGITGAIIQSLAKVAAQELVTWGIKQIVSKWESANTKKKVGESATVIAANTAEANSSIFASMANFFKAHSWIPWVGAALAVGFIAVMMSKMNSAKATARAVGGRVDKPEFTLLGEAGPEIVAPEKDFKDWTKSIAIAGMNLHANLQASQSRTTDYHQAAAAYGSAAQAQGERNLRQGQSFVGGGGIQINNAGATFIGVDDRQWSDMVSRGMRNHERSL